MTSRSRMATIALAALAAALLCLPALARADFGIKDLSVTALNKDGSIDLQAGSRPYEWTLRFDMNLHEDAEETPDGTLRTVIVDLPKGMVGNPLAVPRCKRADFEGIFPHCPPASQIGFAHIPLAGLGVAESPVFNLVPPLGVPAAVGLSIDSFNGFQEASVLTEQGYGVRVSDLSVPTSLSIQSVEETIWGVPASEGHRPERVCPGEPLPAIGGPTCPSGALEAAFLTLPTSCEEPLQVTVSVDSLEDPGNYVSKSALSLDEDGRPAPLEGCESVPFSPKIAASPSSRSATSASGLNFELSLPNIGLESPGGIAETEPRKAVVTLPEGMTVNPSAAEGTGVCSPQQYAAETLDSKPGQGCPESSKLGSLIAHTPLLDEPIEGSLYLAKPYDNPSGTLLALYIVARVPDRGILVKQAGKVEPDPKTGQLVTTFEGLPPLPYSDFKMHFREGPRAPLATPPACGSYQTVAELTPFSTPNSPYTATASFRIEQGSGGGPCPTGGPAPFKPGLAAGTLNNRAGSFSPFNLRLFRNDSEQEITHFSIKLPPGITGKLAGIPYCSDAAIAAAKARTGQLGGHEELADPSCPAASEIGRTLAGAGVGSALVYAPGKVYLAGPYNGSNLSIVAITAGVVGPFDIGTIVVREALRVNPETAEVFIDATGSDPIPHIILGVPVHLRDIRAYVDRPEFVLNPTDCTPTSTASTVLGAGLDFASEADDNPVTVATRFQAADCAALPFKPQLSLRLVGGTKRGKFPKLVSHLAMNGIGEAGIDHAQIVLPHSEFIENAHFNNICTRVQFKEGAGNGSSCPAGSIYGHARAVTPLLSEPLEGPVMLRSNPERKLPDVVAALHNQQVDFDLVGNTDSVKGRLRSTFAAAPDAPVTSFDLELFGGSKGLFVNSTNLCLKKHFVGVAFGGQNGKAYSAEPLLQANCKGKARKHKRHGKRGGR